MMIDGQPDSEPGFVQTIFYGFLQIVGLIIFITLILGTVFGSYVFPILKDQFVSSGLPDNGELAGMNFVWFALKVLPFGLIFSVIIFLIIYIFKKERDSDYF